MKRNLTVQLDEATIRKARRVAARRAISMSSLVREQIEQAARRDSLWQANKRTALRHLANPLHLGGGEMPAKDELHDR